MTPTQKEPRMDQHTPGPWTVERFERDGLIGFRILDATNAVVAEINPRPYRVAVHEPNARLIAKAPAMLDVLEALVDEVQALDATGCVEDLAGGGYYLRVCMDNAHAILKETQP